jgi:Fic family protein
MTIFEWLKSRGYDYTWNVKVGKGKPDIVAFNNSEIVAIEFKKNGIKSSIDNCRRYLKEANRAYIVSKSHESAQSVKKYGIGLIDENDKTKLVIEAKHFPIDRKKSDRIIKDLQKKSLLGNSVNNFKEKIVELLRQNPDGLTILGIARALKMHRHTASKYVSELIKEGKIVQRMVGPAKLCYLKKAERESVEK